MAKRLQELSLLNGTPRGQARLLIKDNPTGFLEDYSISVNDFKSDLIFSREASIAPNAGQIPRIITTDGVPALPALSAKNLTHIEATLPTGNEVTQGLLRLSDAPFGTSDADGGIAATPLAVRNVNIAKPDIAGATITGAWTFNAGATFNAITVTGTSVLNQVSLNGNIVSNNRPLTISTTGNNSAITLAAGNVGNTSLTLKNNGNLTVRGDVAVDRLPTEGNHLANKTYVDRFDTNLANNLVHKTGDETISGFKTFTTTINVTVERVALELKADDEQPSIIVDYGNHTSDYVVRNEVMLPASPQHGQIKFTHHSSVPVENREMYINNQKVYHQGNDGAGSGLDADLLDGKQSGLYVQTDAIQTITAQKTFATATNLNGTVNVNTDQINFQTPSVGQVPRLIISGQANSSNQIGYIQFENKNGGAFGGEAATRANLSVDTSFNMSWNGNRILTVADNGSGRGIHADLVDGLHGSDIVSIMGNQTIGGQKIFSNKVTVNNSFANNKQFEISGGQPSINLSSSTANATHYKIQNDNTSFSIYSDTAGNDVFANEILDINNTNRTITSYGKTLLNNTDDANIHGEFTFGADKNIYVGGSQNAYFGAIGNGSPVISGTGFINIIANSNNSVENSNVNIRATTTGLNCIVSRNEFTVVKTDSNSFMTNFLYSGDNGTSIVRFTGRRNVNSSEVIAQLQVLNNADNSQTNLFFKADKTLEYTGTGGFVTNNLTVPKINLTGAIGSSLVSTGSFSYVGSFNESTTNGNAPNVWDMNGGGLLVRGEAGVAGVLDSRNMEFARAKFFSVNVGAGGLASDSLVVFRSGNKNFVNTRNGADAALSLNHSDMFNVNGIHFTPDTVGMTFLRTGSAGNAANYSSLKVDNTGIVYKPSVTGTTEYHCATLSYTDGISYPCLTWGNGTQGHIRTANHGLLPFAPSGDARNQSSIGTSTWRFNNIHGDILNAYTRITLHNRAVLVTSQTTAANQTLINMPVKVSTSSGVTVNSNMFLASDDSGSGIKFAMSVTPTGGTGSDNIFSVKTHDGKPKLYVGGQRTGTQNSNFYVGVANNGSGGKRVIHEGDGGRLLSAEAII